MGITDAELGARVGRFRRQRHLTQEDLAELIGLDQPKLSKIEAGSRRVSSTELVDLAAALHVDPLDLVEDEPLVLGAAIVARTDSGRSNTAIEIATKRAHDALRTWRQLDHDGFELRLGRRPALGSMRRTVRAGETAAEKLRTEIVRREDPVDLSELAEHVGLVVRWVPLGEGIDGLCVADEAHGVAVVNTHHWGSRQRFTLAHEIGHWVLGDVADRGGRADEDVFAVARDPIERRANAFAAALLLPRDAVASMDQADRAAAVRFAYRRGVSCTTLGWRIKNAVGETELSRWLRDVRPFQAAVMAGELERFQEDADDRDKEQVSGNFAETLFSAFLAGALSERRLTALVPMANAGADGPADD